MPPTSRRHQSVTRSGANGVLPSWVFVASLVVAMLGLCVMVGWLLSEESTMGIAAGWSSIVVTASGITVAAVLGARTFGRSRTAIAGHVGTVEEVAPPPTAQQTVIDAEEVFSRMFESSPVGMALIDTDGFVTRVNRALCELTYYLPEELITFKFEPLLHADPGDVGTLGQENEAVDRLLVRADGSLCWASISYAHVGEDGGSQPSLVTVQLVDTCDRRHLEEQSAQMGGHDFLTGLLNRRSFETALSNHVAYCNRYGPAGAVLMLDLDDFGVINETYGHDVGDQLVVTTAHLIQQRVRASDLVARLGGEHFVVLLPAGHGAGARAVAQILVDEIHSNAAGVVGDHILLTVSIGVAVFDDIERSADEMMVNAGLAMFDAMDLGGDRWAQFASVTYGERAFRPDSRRSNVVVEQSGFALVAQGTKP